MLVQPAGVKPWAILQVLVKPTAKARPNGFNPSRSLPNNLQLTDLFTKTSAAGDLPFDLWNTLSFGRVKIDGSKVFGPFDAIRQDGMVATTDDWDNMVNDDASNKHDRIQKILSGIRGAQKQRIDLSPFWGVVVVPDYQIDRFATYTDVTMDFSIFSLTRPMGCVLLDYNDLSTGSCMHEMGHGFGFNDARGEIKPQPGGVYGDPVDVMSYANCRFFAGTNGRTGPGFNAAALWLRGSAASYRCGRNQRAVWDTRSGVHAVTALRILARTGECARGGRRLSSPGPVHRP